MTKFPTRNKTSDSYQNISLSQSAQEMKPLILIISADGDTRFLFKTLLELWDYRVEEVETLEESISTAERMYPSLALMDTSLSFPDNMTRMRQMRQSEVFSQMPIVLISGYSQPRFRQQAFISGADDFLVKPVDFDALKDCLDRNIEKGKQEGGNIVL